MKYSTLYKNTLLNDILPFWENNSIDSEYGGYFTCIDKKGKVYDTDKFIWLQGRQAWTFSMLYNKVKKNEKWLAIAKNGIDFLRKYCMNEKGDFYFSVTQEGKPLVQAYNIFSDCFAAMAFSQYAIASGDDEVKELAKKTYFNILNRIDNPKGKYEKNTYTRQLIGFSLPMILSNLVLELEELTWICAKTVGTNAAHTNKVPADSTTRLAVTSLRLGLANTPMVPTTIVINANGHNQD